METRIYRIAEIGNVIGGGTPSTANPEYWDGEIPWISPKDLTGYNSTYISRGEKNITEKGLNKSGTRLLPKHTILFTSRAPIGYVALASNPICTNQGFKSIVCDESKVVPLFLYYYLKANLDYIKLFGSGATFPEISGNSMKKIKINIFSDTNYQRRIASILSAYDNLIENNNRRIRLLEQMAENLYKEWFVRFRFPNYQNTPIENGIPKGWRKGQLGEIVNFLNGFAFKSETFVDCAPYKVVTIKNVQDGKFDGINVDYIEEVPKRMPQYCNLLQGDILLSLTGNVGRVCIVLGSNYLLNQRVAKLTSDHPHFTYCLFRTDTIFNTLNSIAYGTAQLNLSPIKAARLKMLIPPVELRNLFDKQVASLFTEIATLQTQSANLTRQRDLLLPRLMSGQLPTQ